MNVEFLSAAAQQTAEQAAPAIEWSVWAWVCQSTGWNYTALTVTFALLCAIVPYLLGSINPAIIFSKVFFHDDIRSHGSGNAGATNTLRTYGKKMSILVLGCDILKALISVGFGWLMMGHSFGGAIAGFFVILGHMFPIYYKFKGGKGVACAAAVVLMMSPLSFLFCFLVFVIIVVGTKYVSLASIIGIGLYPLFTRAFIAPERQGAIGLFAVLIAVFVIFMHRGNMKRLFNGEESKISLGKKDKEQNKACKDKKKPEKIYKDSDFVRCEGCGHTIPVARETCVYCGEKNPAYAPREDDKKSKKRKKR